MERTWFYEEELANLPDKNPIQERRAGTFEIDTSILINLTGKQYRLLFGSIIVTRAEHCFMPGKLQYEAYSPFFDETGLGADPGRYVLEFKKVSETSTMARWVKMEY